MKIHIYHHHIIEDSCELERLRKENEELKKQMDQWLARLGTEFTKLEAVAGQVDSKK